MPRSDQGAQHRLAILTAAYLCFADKGYRGTTLDDIRRAAGLSIGSIYYHFSSKEQLAHALYVEGLTAFHAALLADLARAPDARAGIEGMVRFDLAQLADPAIWSRYRFPAGDAHLAPATHAAVEVLQQTFATEMSRWLEPHIAAGRLSQLPVAFYLALLFGPVHDFAEGWLDGRREPTLGDATDLLPAAAWAALRQSAAT